MQCTLSVVEESQLAMIFNVTYAMYCKLALLDPWRRIRKLNLGQLTRLLFDATTGGRTSINANRYLSVHERLQLPMTTTTSVRLCCENLNRCPVSSGGNICLFCNANLRNNRTAQWFAGARVLKLSILDSGVKELAFWVV